MKMPHLRVGFTFWRLFLCLSEWKRRLVIVRGSNRVLLGRAAMAHSKPKYFIGSGDRMSMFRVDFISAFGV